MDALQVGKQIVALCNEGKNLEAVNTLYSDDVASIEVMGSPDMPARMEGIEAIRQKTEWWYAHHEVHSGECIGPFPHGDQFILYFKYDVTPKGGPRAGQRMQFEEAGLYTVRDGKVVEEKFFYDMSGAEC